MKVLKWVGGIILVLIVIGIVAGPDAPESAEAKPQDVASLPEVSAKEIAVAYNENTVSADMRFKDKQFKVSGTVADINTDFTGDPYITMRGGVNEFMEPHFDFDKSALQQLAGLKKGMKVTLRCTGGGDVAKTPMSKDCSIL